MRHSETTLRQSFFKALALLGPTLLLFIPIAYKYKSFQEKEVQRAKEVTAQKERSAKQAIEAKRHWPLPPLPRISVHKEPPTAPRLPYVIQRQDKFMWSVSERLRLLVQQHPVLEIREDFDRLIADGSIALEFIHNRNGANAEFSVVPIDNIVSYSDIEIPADRKVQPVLSLDITWISTIKQEDALFAQLVVYHEYQHYKQWSASVDLDRKHWEKTEVPERTQESACAHMWQAESDAYAAECRIAWDWGMPFMLGNLCAYVDTQAWDQALFHDLYNGSSSRAKTSCGKVWATLARHPYPEVY